MRTEIRALIFDESDLFRESLGKSLFAGHRGIVESTSDLAQATEWLRDREHDLCVFEYRPDLDGFSEFLSEIESADPSETAIVVVARETEDVLRDALKDVPVAAVVSKVFDSEGTIASLVGEVLLKTCSRTLVIDEHNAERRALSDRIRQAGFFDVLEAENGLDALLQLPTLQPDLILLGTNNRDMPVRDFLREVRKDDPDIRILVLTDVFSSVQPAELMRSGANDCHPVGVSQEDLAKSIFRQMEIRRSAFERKRLQTEIEERDRQVQKELELGGIIQRRMLPRTMPDFAGYRFSVVHSPSRQIGGDFYDFQRADEDHLVVVLSDVSGHGIPGALLCIVFKIYWEIVVRETRDLAEVLKTLAERLYNIYPSGSFASTFVLSLDPAGQVRYVKASQEPALWIRSDGSIEEVTGDGMVLGLFDPEFDTEPWEEKEFTLKPGEKILLYTDGVTEARSPDGEEYGYERLVELLKANGSLPSDELAHKIAEEAARFHEKDSFEDDLTVLVIERPQD